MAKAEYRSAIRSRKLIMEAMAKLLIEKPLHKITVTDIVNTAGINRGTFYAHYSDIPQLMESLLTQTFSQIQEEFCDESLPPVQEAHVFLQKMKNLLDSNSDFYRSIIHSPSSPVLHEAMINIAVNYFLNRKKRHPEISDAEFEMTIRFCAGGISNLFRDWFAGRLPCSLEEVTAAAESMVCSIVQGQQNLSGNLPG